MAPSVGRILAAVQSDKRNTCVRTMRAPPDLSLRMDPKLPCPATDISYADLDAQGLNLHAVFNLADLPADILAALPTDSACTYRQLLLIGNYGGAMWHQLNLAGRVGPDPIDRFSQDKVTSWLERHHPNRRFHFVYPGPTQVGLQRLGELTGWHHPSPFMVGIDSEWGSWFAYRAVVLTDTDLPPTPRREGASPCDTCAGRMCVSACPAGALTHGFNLTACMSYRLSPASSCQDRCVARNTCPVGADHRYSDAQIRYHYGQSMKVIQRHALPG